LGKRGPARKPGKDSGSWRGDRAEKPPSPKAGKPTCPRWLSKKAKEYFRGVLKILDGTGVVTVADGHALARLCQAWERYEDLEATIQEEGVTFSFVTRGGDTITKPRPEVIMQDKTMAQIIRLEAQFGLTPSARASLAVLPPKEEKNTADRFFAPKLKKVQ